MDAISTSDGIQLAIAAITAVAALAAVLSVGLTAINERRRTQPIVIAHEYAPRRFSEIGSQSAWVVDAYLTSEGAGPAFNVRFGVEFSGVRYPYRLSSKDPDSGNIQRVLRPTERRPEQGTLPVLLDSLSLWGRAAQAEKPGDLDSTRLYWARYENAKGQTWETRNPGDRSAKLDIQRVRFTRLVERREAKRREAAGQHDRDWIKKALDELRAGAIESNG